MIFVVEQTGKVGTDILLVDPCTGFDCLARMTDGIAVLDDILALGEILQGNLMPCGNVFEKRNCLSVNIQHSTCLLRENSDHDVVGRIDSKNRSHR